VRAVRPMARWTATPRQSRFPMPARRGRRTTAGARVGRIPGQLLGLLDRQRMQAAQQLDPGFRAQRLEEAAVHAGKINGPRARHAAIESEPAGECHPHIAKPIPRAAPSRPGR
jgi:hypothetical protein